MNRALLSPDTEDILDAIATINNGASIVPDDLDDAVSHTISKLGCEAIAACCGKPREFKRSFLIAAAMFKR